MCDGEVLRRGFASSIEQSPMCHNASLIKRQRFADAAYRNKEAEHVNT